MVGGMQLFLRRCPTGTGSSTERRRHPAGGRSNRIRYARSAPLLASGREEMRWTVIRHSELGTTSNFVEWAPAQWPTGAGPPSFTLRMTSASGTAASEISINTQKASM
jgi:hypothetical protein